MPDVVAVTEDSVQAHTSHTDIPAAVEPAVVQSTVVQPAVVQPVGTSAAPAPAEVVTTAAAVVAGEATEAVTEEHVQTTVIAETPEVEAAVPAQVSTQAEVVLTTQGLYRPYKILLVIPNITIINCHKISIECPNLACKIIFLLPGKKLTTKIFIKLVWFVINRT